MANDNNDDAIEILIGLGVLTVVGIGVFKVVKAMAGYRPNQTISKPQAVKLASTYTSSYQPSPNCVIHGEDADLCENCHGCMDSLGRDDDQFSVNCYYD